MFKALGSFNFRLYYFSQVFSFMGNLIQEVALSWLIYRVTGEAFYVGLLFFMKKFATFLLAPFAGVLSDHISRRNILLITNLSMVVLASLMGSLVVADYNILVTVLTVQFIQGIITGIDMPVRQAFVKDLVDDDSQLINAIALNSSLFNIARVVGPLLAGVLIPLIGEGICFIINGTSYLTVVMGILFMRNVKAVSIKRKINFIADIKEGFVYSFSHPPIRNVILVTAAIGLFGFPYNTLLPVFTRTILHGNEQTLALLITSIGIGSLIAAFIMASRKSAAGLFVLICIACIIYGLGLFLFSQSQVLSLAIFMMVQVGLGQVLIFSSANSVLQTMSKQNMTGRVISFYIMAFMGCTTIGSLAIGALADFIGVVQCLAICGLGCIATSLFLLFTVGSIKKRMIVTLRLRQVRRMIMKLSA